MRTCKTCKIKFKPIYSSVQMCCSPKCAIEYDKILKAKAWKAEKKKIKEKLKTNADHVRELQVIFNKFIRFRDKDKGCISCGTPLINKYDAGHYYSCGSYPELRFEEDNVHGQCVYCNQHKHGNLIEYGKRLPERIGEVKYHVLDVKKNINQKYSIPELIELKVIYKQKLKEL